MNNSSASSYSFIVYTGTGWRGKEEKRGDDVQQNRWTRTGRSDEEKRKKELDGFKFGSVSMFPWGLLKHYSRSCPVPPCPQLWIDWMDMHTYIQTGTHKFCSLLHFKTIYSHIYYLYLICSFATSFFFSLIFPLLWKAICQVRFSCPKHQALTWSITCPPLPLPQHSFPKLLQLPKWTEPPCLSSFLSPFLYL